MNRKMIGKIISFILIAEAIFMLPPLILSFVDHEPNTAIGFAYAMITAAVIACILFFICRKAQKGFHAREGFISVGLSWLLLSFIGAFPLFFSNAYPTYIDSLFEIVSGFTTTGCSVMADVESLPRAVLLWKSMSNWIGGMGILVFLLAIAPLSDKNEGFTLHLLRAESPGPSVEKIVPHIKRSAAILYIIYIALTVICFFFLLGGKMSVFDSACTAMSTAGTGGFSLRNDGFAGFSSYIQIVTAAFMFLFGINFTCYYMLILREFRVVSKDLELRTYFLTAIICTLFIAINIYQMAGNLGDSLKHAFFQVSSIITTTGFSSCDFDVWPALSKTILFLLMFSGGCAGSTAGGFKISRILILYKGTARNVRQIFHPNKVEPIRMNGSLLEDKLISSTYTYLGAYLGLIIVSLILISLDNFSFETNITAVVSCFNNIGPGFASVGPTKTFFEFSVFSKIVLIFDMLAGRLEIFPILILFSRSGWQKWAK